MPLTALHRGKAVTGASWTPQVAVAPVAKPLQHTSLPKRQRQLCSILPQAHASGSSNLASSRDNGLDKHSQQAATQPPENVEEDAYEDEDEDAEPSTSTSSSLAGSTTIRRRFARGRRGSSRQSRAQGRGQDSPGLVQRRQPPRMMPVQIPLPAGRLYDPHMPGEGDDEQRGGGGSTTSVLPGGGQDLLAPEAQALEQLMAGAAPQVREAFLSRVADSAAADMDRELEGLSPGQVKALMAAARDAQATGDVGYWERTLLRPVMHQQLKQDLGLELSSLLEALVDDDEALTLGEDTDTGRAATAGAGSRPGGPSSGVMRRRLERLTQEQRQRLPELLAELEDIRDANALLGQLQEAEEEAARRRERVSAARLNRLAKSKGLTPPSLEEEEVVTGKPQAKGRARSGQDHTSSQQQQGGQQQAASAQGLAGVALQAGLDPATADLVTRLDAVYRRYNPESGSGWEQEGYLGTPELRSLKRAALTLRGVAAIQTPEDLQERGLSAADLAAAVEGAMQELEDLMEAEAQGSLALDPVARSSLLFLRTQLMTRPAQGQQQAGEGSGKAPNQGGGGGGQEEEGELELPVEPERLDKLLTFIPAAETWEALHALAASWEGRHPGVAFSEAHKSSPGLGGPGDLYWWVAEQQEQEEEQEGKEQEASTRAAGRPSHLTADWEKIQALSALDASLLRALDELDAAGYSEEVLMKWSLHPVVGPRLSSGRPLVDPQELPEEWRKVWEAANAWEWPGIDYKWEERPVTDPVALAQAQRLVAQHPEPRLGRLATGLKRQLLTELRRQRNGPPSSQ